MSHEQCKRRWSKQKAKTQMHSVSIVPKRTAFQLYPNGYNVLVWIMCISVLNRWWNTCKAWFVFCLTDWNVKCVHYNDIFEAFFNFELLFVWIILTLLIYLWKVIGIIRRIGFVMDCRAYKINECWRYVFTKMLP